MSVIDNKLADPAVAAPDASWLSSASVALPSFITVSGLALGGGSEPLEFTLYHKQADGRVTPLCRAGSALTETDRNRFMPAGDRPGEVIYVAAGEYDVYHRRVEAGLGRLVSEEAAGASRFQAAYQICVQLVDEVLNHGKDELAQRVQSAVDQLAAEARRQPQIIAGLLAQRSWVYETASHMVNVALLALAAANDAGLPANDWPSLVAGAMLHDIGKIGLPEGLTGKEGRLTQGEWMLIREHPARGAEWLRQFSCLNPLLADLAMQHHEFADGSGYPQGLAGGSIHPWARLYSTLDAFDSLTAARPFREGLPVQDALTILQSESPRRFDPASVATLARLIASGAVAAPASQLHAGGAVMVAATARKLLPLESFLPLPPAPPVESPLDASAPQQRRRNRRSYVRHPFKTTCRVRYVRSGAAPDAHISFWVQTLDISRSGMQFMFTRPMRLGEVISVFLPTGQTGRHVTAMVVRCYRGPSNVFFIGARFDFDK
ncbi:MAG: HD domain-containing protein [Phycisphaerae bacterium]|nr:HD domain-containing protein [Phycisphaerae bacterium]